MKRLLLTLGCLLTLGMAIAQSSNYGYPQYRSYPVYYPPAQVYNNTYNNYIPYAVPLYSSGAYQPTAVISGAVAYQQTITAVTSATAGAASSVQSVLGAEVGLAQQQVQQGQAGRFDRLLAAMEKQYGIVPEQAQGELPYIGLLRTNCAECHSGQGARKSFQLFDKAGKFVLDQAQTGKVLFRLSTNKTDPVSKKSMRMPPNAKLPQDAHDAIVEGLVTQPEQKAEPVPDPKKEEGF